MNHSLSLVGRLLISCLFLKAAFDKMMGYAFFQQFMESVGGVPGWLLPVVILADVVLGLMILVGYRSRPAALALAAYTLLAGFIFHFKLDDKIQMLLFIKNIAITGGLLVLAANGAGLYSFEEQKKRRNA